MREKTTLILLSVLIFAVNGFAVTESTKSEVVSVSIEQQYGEVQPGAESALAVHFDLKEDWHFYASAKTAPGGMNLKVKPSAGDYIRFSKAIFPKPYLYFDKSSGKKLEVFSDKFTVFLPFGVDELDLVRDKPVNVGVRIDIAGAVCSGFQCRMPDFGQLGTEVKIVSNASMSEAGFTLPVLQKSKTPIKWYYLGLAFLAGLSLNIMPCVWPVLPLIVMRLVEQAKEGKGKSISMGLSFCLGILLFFASLAAANIVLQIIYGTVLQWGDQFRNPAFVAAMALLLVVLSLFMFGVFTIRVPSAISSKSGSGKGYTGAVGMGFLAAILSTPCSFAILAAAFAWAQAQPLPLATLAIMVIGVGMAVPYAILTSMPALLERTPKPGRWMELFKQGIGFILLIIAVKLIGALPQLQRTGVLYFAIILAFCIWMWNSWVGFDTKPAKKWLVRIIAVVIAVAAGAAFLPAPAEELIDWQKYDGDLIEDTLTQGRPVLIKFTADWCLSCQVVEKIVYSRKDIANLIEEKKVLAIKADTTVKDYPATLALKNKYNEPGVPVSMLFVPGGNKSVKWRSMAFADELKIELQKLSTR